MNLQGKKITLHEMSLRDGMHPQRHQITLDQMIAIATACDEAGMPLIEVTHGDGLGGSSVNYGFGLHSDEEYLRAVIPRMKQMKVSALLLPGIGTVDHLRMAVDCGVHCIRVATHCTEADVSAQHRSAASSIAPISESWSFCFAFICPIVLASYVSGLASRLLTSASVAGSLEALPGCRAEPRRASIAFWSNPSRSSIGTSPGL